MNYLMGTQVFIWWNISHTRLSSQVLAIFQDRDNELCLSVASLWEMQIKSQLGKLILPTTLMKMVRLQKNNINLKLIPIKFKHVLTLQQLPEFHKDPFDRMIIAQAVSGKMPVLPPDSQMKRYPVSVIW